jgi:hypothetical protein
MDRTQLKLEITKIIVNDGPALKRALDALNDEKLVDAWEVDRVSEAIIAKLAAKGVLSVQEAKDVARI